MNNEEEIRPEPSHEEGSQTSASAPQSDPPSSGRRLALRGVRRQLTDAELSQPGVQKLLLDMLEEAETDRDNLETYVTSFHEADKRASVLGEKLNADRSIETLFGVGVGLGGAIMGLTPFFWVINFAYGVACFVVGLFITVGATIGRIVKR